MCVSPCLACRQVAALAGAVLKAYLASVPAAVMAPALCGTALHDKDRLRAAALRLLADRMAAYAHDAATAKK